VLVLHEVWGKRGGESQSGICPNELDGWDERSSPQLMHYLPTVSIGGKYGRRERAGQCGRASAFLLFTSATHARVCSLQELRSLSESSRSCRRTCRLSSASPRPDRVLHGSHVREREAEMGVGSLNHGGGCEPPTYGRDGHLKELFEGFCDGNGGI
jgi:hypothetical protein